MKISDTVAQSLHRWGDYPVFREMTRDSSDISVSAEKFMERMDETIRFLKRVGIEKNHLVILFLENSVDFISIFLSLIEMGARPIPCNLSYRRIELDEIFSNARPHAIIAESYHHQVLRHYSRGTIFIERKEGKLKLSSYLRFLSLPDKPDIDESIASINYTYRGHGYPLGAMVPHSQYFNGSEVLVDGLRPEPGESMLVLLPYCYIFPLIGCLFAPLMFQITSVISNTVDPVKLFGCITEHKISIVTAVPEIYELMYSLREAAGDMSSLAVFVSGGSTLTEETYHNIRETFNVEFLHGYGLTEFTPVSRNLRGEARPGTIGPFCRGVNYRISGVEGSDFGEILIKTTDMVRAYYRRHRESSEAFEDGWFKTGDMGRISDGHLIFEGEKKGTRKVKGNMVDLEEVRRALLMYPKVKDALVGFRQGMISAKIAVKSAKNFDREILELKLFLDETIARYKIPKVIEPL